MLYYPGPQGISPLFTGKYIQNDTSFKKEVPPLEIPLSLLLCRYGAERLDWKGLILCLIGLNLVPLLLAARPAWPSSLVLPRGPASGPFQASSFSAGQLFHIFRRDDLHSRRFCDISTFSVNCGEQENRGTVFVREGRSPAESLPGNGPLVRLGAAPERGTVCPPLSGL